MPNQVSDSLAAQSVADARYQRNRVWIVVGKQ